MNDDAKAISAQNVEKQLILLRSSPLFSHSRRYPLFLEYIVRKTLDGRSDELKERIVGIEAFGRPSDYDLNADPIVRVTAGEVRKRLAQYYYQADHHHELRIELNPGSYVPEFKTALAATGYTVQTPKALEISGSAQTIETGPNLLAYGPPVLRVNPRSEETILAGSSAETKKWKWISASLAIALAMATVGATLPQIHRASSTDIFWQPVLDANGPVFISVASVVAMVNNNAVAPSPNTVSGHPLASDPIAVSDATALSRIQQVLSMRSKTSTLASSTSTSFSDLQKGPVVLISAFDNQWTMRITNPLRFHFVQVSTNDYTIQDRSDPDRHRWDVNGAEPFVKMNQDFGIVARFYDPTTEQIVVVAAGIGENGTIAASKFLTDDRFLSELKLQKLMPRPNQNFEGVIEAQTIDGKPGPPRLVASYIW